MIHFPWTSQSAPHLVLEISSECNIACRACYKRKSGGLKSLAEIERDLEAGLHLRRVHTVSIAGAEPTLHPHLPDIVRKVRERGLRAALITNGLLLPDDLLAQLKAAGVDVVMIHIDEGQSRPDLPPQPTVADLNALRLKISARVAAHGIDAGLCATIYHETLPHLLPLIDMVLETDHVGFLFATQHVCQEDLLGEPRDSNHRTDNADVVELLKAHFGLEPFACAGDQQALHWMSYLAPVIQNQGRKFVVPLISGRVDEFLISLPWRLTGRHCYYYRSPKALAWAHLLANCAGRGDWSSAARVLAACLGSSRLGIKRMVFDNGLRRGPGGHIECLEFCPNATIRHGKLVPVCLSDYLGSAPTEGS